MSLSRHLGAGAVLVASMVLVSASVASAHHRHRGFDNVWFGTPEADVFPGDGQSNRGRDLLFAKAGDDVIAGGPLSDVIHGGLGDDELLGEDGHDIVHGGAGNDLVYGGDGADHVFLGPGDDGSRGGFGPDLISGGDGNDRMAGGPGRDLLLGGRGDDTIHALDGQRDWVDCGPGMDSYTADAFDRVARDCELDITPVPAPAP